MPHPELLAPAGTLEKLKTALAYGADAVYAGLTDFSLRAHAGNLTLAELETARRLTAAAGRRLYLALNAYVGPGELAAVRMALEHLRRLAPDALIVSDPGVVALAREVAPELPLHLSTQANTTNPLAAEFWRRQGVRRIVLARELTLDQIRALRAGTGAELEVFVHGALCVAVSGRCLLSAALTGRSANRGDCTHPCRWRYRLTEETRPGETLPIEEDARGTYLMNSRDLCLIEHLPALIEAGIDSFKIEGRMKSVHYVAAVTRVYRDALDRYRAAPHAWTTDPAWREELEKVSHRPYGTGFLFGPPDAGTLPGSARYVRHTAFLGVVEEVAGGEGLVAVRNRFFAGETAEAIGPGMRTASFVVGPLRDEAGLTLAAAQPNARVRLALPAGSAAGDLLRRPAAD